MKHKPFQPKNLTNDLQDQLMEFFRKQDFAKLYKSYAWRRDTYHNGFPDILNLEHDICRAAKNGKISIKQIHKIAKWGGLPNISRIRSFKDTLNLSLYQNDGLPLNELSDDPLLPLHNLDRLTRGLGPTYLTKVLRFCLPIEYGAIDTRLVRVLGLGDPASKRHSWLTLRVTKEAGRFSISRWQGKWPSDYSKWLNILRLFANLLNNPDTKQPCPHPSSFVDKELRLNGIWACADIEMAIFSYASRSIHSRK